jgi:transketolase
MQTLEDLCVHTIRTLSIDAVQKANSGHPGMPMGMADAAFVLFTNHLKFNPRNPNWFNRDRFILSAGHGSMLLYSLLHLTGYDVTLDDIKAFRQWGSITPGHPEVGHTPGVETTTGPLGQGFANGVGFAIAEAHLAAVYNTPEHLVVDHFTYGIVSDGDLMEGVSHEAASMAGHLKLGKLIYLYDDNRISIDGSTDLAFTENVLARFEAYGWHVQRVDGHNRIDIDKAIEQAKSVTDQPSIISCRTHIGYGSPNKQDSASSHGSPLGVDEIRLTKQYYGWDPDLEFFIPEEVRLWFTRFVETGYKLENNWSSILDEYSVVQPLKAVDFKRTIGGKLPNDWLQSVPTFEADSKGMATRKASGLVLNAIASVVPNMIGGSADLAGSNNTWIDGAAVFQADSYEGKNFHFGVREHAMGSALNGMALHGGIIPYGGTFLVFSDYCRPAIRIAALSKIPSIFIFTHDSIGLGEDGPTHQPVEHLSALRSMPNCHVWRPCDANETAAAWIATMERKNGPSLLVLTRQNLPTLASTQDHSKVLKGGYILSSEKGSHPDAIIMSTGSEVHIALDAQLMLRENGIDARVVSLPCIEVFRKQDKRYIDSILPSAVKNRVAIEAAAPYGWHEWVGENGKIIAIDGFGASAPFEKIYEEYGLTSGKVVEAVLSASS